MVDYINFTEEEFLNLSIEELKSKDFNKIKIGSMPLIFYLIVEDKIEIIKNLSDDLNLNIKNCYRFTPLLLACSFNNFEMVTLLLEYGDNINIETNYGITPLHWACSYNNYEMLELLLGNGAIPYVDEEGNYECLECSKEENKEKMRDFIFKFQTRNIKKVK